jgi:predicted MPP superfamily phosphohydrolase
MGFLLYGFQLSILIRLINLFLPLSLLINFSLQYIIPLLICIYGIINALRTRVENINLKYPGFKGKIKILLLSDIHLGAIHQKNSVIRIVQETQQLNPDIVVITGDMADGSLKVKSEWLKPFDDLSIPILYVTGNHEELNPKIDMINAVKTTKIKYIGQHETFKYKGVNFIGEDFGYDLRKCLREVKQEEGVPNVLLSHIPTLNPEELKNYNIFLFLAGHTHGGQMFPLHIIVYFANACFSGLYSDKNKEHFIYVTDGVNNALAPMRVGSKRVFPIINIEG